MAPDSNDRFCFSSSSSSSSSFFLSLHLFLTQMCSSCALTGANLGCIYSGCHERFHFLCAKRSDCDFNEGNFSILCARHKVCYCLASLSLSLLTSLSLFLHNLQGKYNRTSLDNNPDSFMTSTLF